LSISSFQDKVIKGGCGKAVMFLAVASMAIGIGFSSCSRADRFQALDAKGQPEKPFAKVGGVELPTAWIQEAVDQQLQQFGQGNPDILNQLPPDMKLGFYAQAIGSVIQQGYMFTLASRAGIKVDDTNIKKDLGIDTVASFKAKVREQLETSGQLKKGASEKEFEDFLAKALQGKKIDDVYAEQIKQIDELLKDPVKKSKAVLSATLTLYQEKLRKDMKPTDDDVKKSFDTYEVKQIVTNGADRAKIDKAYADIKGGKTFEEIADAVSEAPAMQGKKKSESLLPVPGSMLTMPDYEPIAKLQPGAYSEPVKTAVGFVIYKFVGKKSNVPKDFDTSKDQYRLQYIGQEIQRKIQKDVEGLEKDMKPEFMEKAYEGIYAFSKASSKTDPKEQAAEYQRIYDLVKGVSKSDNGYELATATEMACMTKLVDAPGADKAKLKPARIATLEKYVETNDKAWDKRKELIEIFKEDKQAEKAYSLILAALDKNMSYDMMGQSTYSDISATFQTLKTANILKPEQVKEFEGKQKQWLDAKASFDKQQAEYKKQQEADAKKAAEEAKKSSTNAPAKK
jgi:parvulin-like peptidyl-prolyl isomerase